ncbi:MAG: radical SAM protein [Thermodesulfobacteriota bacterium]
MSNLGFQTLYRILNETGGVGVERFFLPERTDIAEYERTGTPLFSLETETPLYEFDLIAFSISFEEDYLNIPKILALGRVPLFSKERTGGAPLAIAGGAAVSLNPEPVADFFDLFVIGEGEGVIEGLLEIISGAEEGVKPDLLKKLARTSGVYVPSLYAFTYDGALVASITVSEGAPHIVRAGKNLDVENIEMPETVIVTPETEFRETVLVEVQKGCGRGCRFCAAGFLYLPPRWRSGKSVKEALRRAADSGIKKVGLVGAAVSEHPDLKDIIRAGIDLEMEVTLSSLRADCIDEELLELLKKAGYKTITIAPEAGSERMRGVINKGITEGEIIEAARMINEAGFTRLKLYFMIGLPTETDGDAAEIAALTLRIREQFSKNIQLSINPFIPKAFTPSQWHGFEKVEVLERRFSLIKKALMGLKGLEIKTFPAKEAFTQALLARGDRRLVNLIVEAEKTGVRRALKNLKNAEEMVYRTRDKKEIMPWDNLDHGLAKPYLWSEYQRGLESKETPPCDVGRCTRCGVCH